MTIPMERRPAHHPGDDLLLAYAAGGLDEAHALLVATHLSLCPACRLAVAEFEAVGGALLEDLEPDDGGSEGLESVLARLDAPARIPPRHRAAAPGDPVRAALPEPLRSYAGNGALRWRSMVPGMAVADIAVGPTGVAVVARARLMRLRGGMRMPHHGHAGSELTLVLDGGYHDEAGAYGRGDVQEADGSIEHTPVTDPEGCLCLAVTSGPLRLTGPLALFNRFIRF